MKAPFSIGCLLSVVITACFWATSISQSWASPSLDPDRANGALAASQTWLAQIDAGLYEDSYSSSSHELQKKVPKDTWVIVLKTLRPQWGPVTARKQIDHVYRPNGIQGLDGECVVINYETSFNKLSTATETVVLRWEDGKWRGAGYNAGPKVDPDAINQPPEPNTEVESRTVPLQKVH